MKIHDIFENEINRYINGVITVGNDDDVAVVKEIEEYVVTKELKPHFSKFFGNYAKSLDHPNSSIGVWISGFFGSGKSHFLKMLSYLLENKVVNGKPTVEYFRGKFDDPLEFSEGIERCCVNANNHTILFNVADYAQSKATGIRDVFSQVFYNHIGYFGKDPRVIKFEKWLDDTGKQEAFAHAYKEISGKEWKDDRGLFMYRKKAIVGAIVEAGICDSAEAESVFAANPSEILSINSLVDDIAAYVKKQPKDYRLVFMVDEIGFYIGDDTNLMLQLQTLVEQLGDKCGGKVWVVVTGQEAIDKVIKVKGDQFNKIMDRFATKLHLTADSVEEVIRKRLLEKKAVHKETLAVIYEQKGAALKNTFTFEQANSGYKGYRDVDEFIADYPFVSYQYRLLQQSLEGIRVHQQSGFTLSGGSRNMLGAFKSGIESGVINWGGKLMKIQEADVGTNGGGALFPFHRFYDTIQENLVTNIRMIFNNAQNQANKGEGLKEEDVNVLKLLYLIRYVDVDMKATLTNIAILMTESIEQDQIALRKRIGESLERLRAQNYVAKNGEFWQFLTDEERDVDVEIQQTIIGNDEISKEIGEVIFSEIYNLKKAKYGTYDFDYSRYVDDLSIGTSAGGLRVSIVSPNNPIGKNNDSALIMKSMGERSVIAVLSDEYPFYERLVEILKIERYSKQKNQASLQPGVKAAIGARVAQAKLDRNAVKLAIEKSLKDAIFYVDGQKCIIKGLTAKDKVAEALSLLISAIYTRLSDITYNIEKPEEIKGILNREESAIVGSQVINQEAVEDLDQLLMLKYQSHSTMTVSDVYKRYKDIPYGFREYDIAGMIAELLLAQKILLTYNGKEYKKSDSMALDLITKKSYTDSVVIKQRITVDPALLTKCINIMKDFTQSMDVPTKEDDFFEFACNYFKKKVQECDTFINDYYAHGNYPKRKAIDDARLVYQDIVIQAYDETKFLERIRELEGKLLDARDDAEDIVSFFNGKQKGIWDDASRKIAFFRNDLQYIEANPDAKFAYDSIVGILGMEEPFQRIAELPGLIQTLSQRHGALLHEEKMKAVKLIDEASEELATYVKEHTKPIYETTLGLLSARRVAIDGSQNIIAVIAINAKVQDIKQEAIEKMLNAPLPVVSDDEDEQDKPIVPPTPKQPKVVSKSEIVESATLATKGDVDSYLEKLKKKLYAFITEGGVKID